MTKQAVALSALFVFMLGVSAAAEFGLNQPKGIAMGFFAACAWMFALIAITEALVRR